MDMIRKEMINYDRSGELMGSKPNFCLIDSSSSTSTRNVTKSMSIESPQRERKWEKVKSILEEHRNLLLEIEAERSYLENDELETLLDALERHPEQMRKLAVVLESLCCGNFISRQSI